MRVLVWVVLVVCAGARCRTADEKRIFIRDYRRELEIPVHPGRYDVTLRYYGLVSNAVRLLRRSIRPMYPQISRLTRSSCKLVIAVSVGRHRHR